MQSLFSAVYCINLPTRIQRWASVQNQFSLVGMPNVERWNATAHDTGWVGCQQSHLALLQHHNEYIKRTGDTRPFMVLEDDVVFPFTAHENVQEVISSVITSAMAELPVGWAMLYLGANCTTPLIQHSKHLLRVTSGAYCTHAMIYNPLAGVIDLIRMDLPKIPLMKKSKKRHGMFLAKIDVFLTRHVQPVFPVFITNPILATQANGHSDVVGAVNDYHNLILDSFNKNKPA